MTDLSAVVLARRNQHIPLHVALLAGDGALLVGVTDLVRTEQIRVLMWIGAPAIDIPARVVSVDLLDDGRRAIAVSFVDPPEHVVERIDALVAEQLARAD